VRTRENTTDGDRGGHDGDLRKLPSQLVKASPVGDAEGGNGSEAANQKAEAVMSHRAPSPESWPQPGWTEFGFPTTQPGVDSTLFLQKSN
jgi:hypothetical protein